jgi:hypothetical protein
MEEQRGSKCFQERIKLLKFIVGAEDLAPKVKPIYPLTQVVDSIDFRACNYIDYR